MKSVTKMIRTIRKAIEPLFQNFIFQDVRILSLSGIPFGLLKPDDDANKN
jgi:hypothetical protein